MNEAEPVCKGGAAIALLAIVAIAAVVRIVELRQPIRYDEAATYLEYVRPASSPLGVMRAYSANNHLLHSVCVWFAVKWLGNAEWAIRLPAWIAGIGIVPMVYVVFGRISASPRCTQDRGACERDAGLIAAALAAGSAPLIFFSVNARGYSLIGLITLVCFQLATKSLRDSACGAMSNDEPPEMSICKGGGASGWPYWIALAAAAMCIGMGVVPIMLFPCMAVVTWMILSIVVGGSGFSRRAKLVRLGVSIAIAIALTGLIYLPAYLNVGADAIAGNKWVRPHRFAEFLRDLWLMPAAIERAWSAGWPRGVAWVVLAAAIGSLIISARGRGTRVSMLLASVIGGAVVLLATRRVPPARVWIWMLPIYFGCTAITCAAVLRWLLRRQRSLYDRLVPALAILLAACGAWGTHVSKAVSLNADTGRFANARAVADLLREHLRPGDRVIATVPADAPIAYYLARSGVEPTAFDTPSAKRLFIVVGHGLDPQLGRDETLGELIGHRRLSADQFTQPERIGHFEDADVYAAARRHDRAKGGATAR